MISVEEAQTLCLGLATEPDAETVPLAQAAGRTLLTSAQTQRAQPPFASAAMDGYAVRDDEVRVGACFTVVGESAAGHGWADTLAPGQAVRIFTGAPVPEGADHVVIQEDVDRQNDTITVKDTLGSGPNIRPLGVDFDADFALNAPRVLSAADVALLAAMNVAEVTVARKPKVALLATGDELVMPGGAPNADQIISSNVFALAAMIEAAGGEAHILPIAADTREALEEAYAGMSWADIRVTIGGASVGDYDLVGEIAEKLGVTRAFYKIAMRPGKPLIAGHFADGAPYLGLPGNPVSAIVCGHLFLIPLVRQMLGQKNVLPQPQTAQLAAPISANGPRQHYMRALLENGEVRAFDNQDSSLLSVLSQANALLIRPIRDPARDAGEEMQILPL